MGKEVGKLGAADDKVKLGRGRVTANDLDAPMLLTNSLLKQTPTERQTSELLLAIALSGDPTELLGRDPEKTA